MCCWIFELLRQLRYPGGHLYFDPFTQRQTPVLRGAKPATLRLASDKKKMFTHPQSCFCMWVWDSFDQDKYNGKNNIKNGYEDNPVDVSMTMMPLFDLIKSVEEVFVQVIQALVPLAPTFKDDNI